MKALMNKAGYFGVNLALFLVVFGQEAEGAQKRKTPPVKVSERAALEPKRETQIVAARAEVNTEFVQRLVDAQFNPEFARKFPDPTQRLKAAQTTADQFCTDFSVSAVKNFDNQGCYIDVTVIHTYTFDPGSTNPSSLPHGIYIEMCPGVQITSPPVTGGAWFAGSTFGSNTSTSSPPWNAVWWGKPVNGFTNIIPSGQPLTVRLRVPGSCAGTACGITVRELTGWAFPSSINFWSCQRLLQVPAQAPQYSIGPNTQLCDGSWSTLTLSPAPSATAQVTWYKAVGPSCPPANCAMLPLGSPWVLDQGGGPSHNTNILNDTTCYVAVIKDGCVVSVSNVKRIEICKTRPNAGIIATPDSGYGPPIMIGQDLHFCGPWKGKLCLDQDPSSCLEVTGWTKDGQPVMDPSGTASKGKCIDTGLLKPGACSTAYVFQANMKNACGPSTATWKIVVDGPPKGGIITANPPPPLCYDRATVLTHKTPCGKVVHWEKREETTPCSNNFPQWPAVGVPIPGSQGTSVWWTNDLQKTTQYRVKVENGACPGPGQSVYSPDYTVTVKPPLTVKISANQTVLCAPGSVTLTAQSSWGPPCPYPVTYQWYKNGVLVGTGTTFSPTAGGNYYVVANGQACGKAKSKVITICDRPKVVITGDCCFCPGKTATLTASTLWTPKGCQTNCTYTWTGSGIIGPTTNATIQVGTPGVYTVTVNCGGCQLPPASFKVDACLTQANPCVLDAGMLQTGITYERRITLAQTFTPTSTGSLTKVTHRLQGSPGSVTSYNLLVTTTTGAGLPSWTVGPYNPPNVLFKATGLTIFATGSSDAVIAIPSGQEPCLTAGTKYALILIPGGPPPGAMGWHGNSSAASYPNGAAYELTGTTWNASTTGPKDHGFKLDGVCPCL